ncbi:MAG: sodium:proton antiporter, partial [Verrucomicrobia bacterium]|nr:sodium:proton antiporter [Verrucomicrobiota bacterium]
MLATAAAELTIPPLLILPFILLLLSIAIIPLISPGWWGKFYSYVSVGLGAITLCYYLFVFKAPTPILHVLHEYISFIALIGSLFVVSGGIHISTRGQALPWMNCAFLLVGSVLSNIVGTTGASMLLIRPWIRMNKRRISGFHIIFFIFIISNISGALTPIGDPPLFLGFLRGVSFWWTLGHCWVGWLVAILLVLAIFFVLDM